MGTTGVELNREVDNGLIEDICKRFNEKLIFDPSARSTFIAGLTSTEDDDIRSRRAETLRFRNGLQHP